MRLRMNSLGKESAEVYLTFANGYVDTLEDIDPDVLNNIEIQFNGEKLPAVEVISRMADTLNAIVMECNYKKKGVENGYSA